MQTFTRHQYLTNQCTHREYYAQFVTPDCKARVKSNIGMDRLLASTDPNLNDIPLGEWDRLAFGIMPADALRAAGDYATLGGQVCTLKEAARQVIEEAQNHANH